MKKTHASLLGSIAVVALLVLQGCGREVSPDEYNNLADRLVTKPIDYAGRGIFLVVSPDRQRLYVIRDQAKAAMELLDAEILKEDRWSILHADGKRIEVSVFMVDGPAQLANQYSDPVDDLMTGFPNSSCVPPMNEDCTRVFANSELHRRVQYTATTVIRPGSMRCTGNRAEVGAERTYANLNNCRNDEMRIKSTPIEEDVCIPANCR